MSVHADSYPIDPIIVTKERSRLTNRISITYIPEFIQLVISDAIDSHYYLKRTDSIIFSANNEYHVSNKLALQGNLNYRCVSINEYLNENPIVDTKEHHFSGNLGMKYEWPQRYITPSIEFSLGYPYQISLSLSGRLIRDPLIHTISLNYNNRFENKISQFALTQSLGFIANDKISLYFLIESLFTSKLNPQINTISFMINYILDNKNQQNITFTNTLDIKDGKLNLGLGYNF